MKILTVVAFFCLYACLVPTPLEANIPANHLIAELKRKVGKRKKGVPLLREAPYPINSSINGRKVNTFNRQSQVNKNNFKINA